MPTNSLVGRQSPSSGIEGRTSARKLEFSLQADLVSECADAIHRGIQRLLLVSHQGTKARSPSLLSQSVGPLNLWDIFSGSESLSL